MLVETASGANSRYPNRQPKPQKLREPLRGNFVAGEEHEFKVHLGIGGIPQDATLEDREKMTKIQNWWTSCELDTIPNRSLPIWRRPANPPHSAKNRVVQFKKWEILNYFRWERSQTVQSPACLKHAPERLIYCSCGVCFRPSPEQKLRKKILFEMMIVLRCFVPVDHSRGATHGES